MFVPKFVLVLIGIAVIAAGAYWLASSGTSLWPSNAQSNPAQTQDNTSTGATTDHQLCAQVITPARDPKTGTIKEFPTPCDVPKGWEVIENDVPSLDLQVQ